MWQITERQGDATNLIIAINFQISAVEPISGARITRSIPQSKLSYQAGTIHEIIALSTISKVAFQLIYTRQQGIVPFRQHLVMLLVCFNFCNEDSTLSTTLPL